MRRFIRYSELFFGLAAGFLLVSCGGGGGGGTGSTPIPPQSVWTFTPDTAAGPSSVSLVQNAAQSNSTVLAIDVVVNGVTGDQVFGAAFDLDFDSAVIAWNGTASSTCTGGATGCMIGNFLETTSVNGVLYEVALQAGGTNKVVIGVTQTGADPGATGSGTLVTLLFKKVAAGSSSLSFSNNALRDPALANISGVTWIGGTVTAQ